MITQKNDEIFCRQKNKPNERNGQKTIFEEDSLQIKYSSDNRDILFALPFNLTQERSNQKNQKYIKHIRNENKSLFYPNLEFSPSFIQIRYKFLCTLV